MLNQIWKKLSIFISKLPRFWIQSSKKSESEQIDNHLVDIVRVTYDNTDNSFNLTVDPEMITKYNPEALLKLSNVLVSIRSDIIGKLNNKQISVGLIADLITDDDTIGLGFITYPDLTSRLDASELLKAASKHISHLSDQIDKTPKTLH